MPRSAVRASLPASNSFIALVLLIGGCLAPQSPADDTLGDAVAALGFALPEALQIGTGADAESSIDVSEDGTTILVCSHGGFTQPSPLWASTDSGATFRQVTPQPNQPFNGDCDISIASDGTWSIAYDTVASASVAVSTDQGVSWSINPVTAYAFVGGVDRPWIHTVDADTLYLTYKSVGGGQPELDIFAISNDAGRTWIQKPYFVPEPPGRTSAIPGDLTVSEDGRTIRVPFVVSGDGEAGKSLENAVSRDGGATFTREPVANVPNANGIPSGDRADDGVLFFGYGASGDDTGDVMVVYSRDDGKTWSEPTVVAAEQMFGGLLDGQVWLDARLDSSATLFWVNRTETDGKTMWQHKAARIHVDDDVVLDGISLVGPSSPPHPSSLYEFATVRHDGAGRAHFAFPLALRPDCKETPQFPSQVGSQNIPRNTACQFVVIEAAP
jgi:hypothetical protein